MRALARYPRPSLFVLALSALVLTGAGQGMAPARAQFFQFFDNRPANRPSRPNTDFWGNRQDNSWGRQDDFWGGGRGEERRAIELRPKRKPHHEKPRPVEQAKPKTPETPKTESAKANAAPAPAEGPPPAYEPQLLRLSEIMGALAYLQAICNMEPGAKAGADSGPWRVQMENLMSAEGAGPSRREKLAGAYNRGLHGYEYSYRNCTANARLARERFLTEGAQLAHDITAQYRAN